MLFSGHILRSSGFGVGWAWRVWLDRSQGIGVWGIARRGDGESRHAMRSLADSVLVQVMVKVWVCTKKRSLEGPQEVLEAWLVVCWAVGLYAYYSD